MIRHARSLGLDLFLVPYLRRRASAFFSVAVRVWRGCAQPMSTECVPVPTKCVKLMRTRIFSGLLALSAALFCCAEKAHADSISCDSAVATQNCCSQAETVAFDLDTPPAVIPYAELPGSFQSTNNGNSSPNWIGAADSDYWSTEI